MPPNLGSFTLKKKKTFFQDNNMRCQDPALRAAAAPVNRFFICVKEKKIRDEKFCSGYNLLLR